MTKLSLQTTHLPADLLETNVIRVIASTQPVVVRGRHPVLVQRVLLSNIWNLRNGTDVYFFYILVRCQLFI